MRVIVCGGRDFKDRYGMWDVLDAIHKETPIKFLFHGNARGADTLADQWGWRESPTVKVCPVPANWKRDGKAAGPKRNKRMLGHGIDLVIAFPGGRGTADMVRQARGRGVKVIEPMSETGIPDSPCESSGRVSTAHEQERAE